MPINLIPKISYAIDADRVDGFHASQTPQANTIPVADSDQALVGWKTKDLTESMLSLTINNGIINWDLSQSNFAQVVLTSNATLNNPSNMKAGGCYVLIVKQDSTGSRILNFGSAFKWPSNESGIPKGEPNSVTVYSFVSDGTNLYGIVVRY